MSSVRIARDDDWPAIREVHRAAFGGGRRTGDVVVSLVDELRADPALYVPDLSFVSMSGDVVAGSIKREGKIVNFTMKDPKNEADLLDVKYVGTDPLPDTFRDYAQAVVAGQYGRDGVFIANSMTAKCASKYEKEAAAGVKTTEVR